MPDISSFDPEIVFKEVLENIKRDKAISKEALSLWFDNCRINGIDKDFVYLSVENEARCRTISTHYKSILSKYFYEILGFEPEIAVFVEKKEEASESEEYADFSEDEEKDDRKEIIFSRKNSYTFENFVVGSSNTFAIAYAVYKDVP